MHWLVAVVAKLFSGAVHSYQFYGKGHHEEHFCEIILMDQCTGEDVV